MNSENKPKLMLLDKPKTMNMPGGQVVEVLRKLRKKKGRMAAWTSS